MDTLLFSTIPANSVILLPEDRRSGYLSKIIAAPEKIRDVAFSDDTGAYIRGLTKGSKITPDDAPKIALSILEVFIGNKNISDLSTLIAQKTGVGMDIALNLASEIDQDLFAPIQGELDAFWAQQSSGPSTAPAQKKLDSLPNQNVENNNRTPNVNTIPTTPSRLRGAKNVLDLKELNARPEQKDLPARPVQKKLMPGNRTVDLSQRPTTPSRPSALPRVAPTPPSIPPKPQFPLPPTRRP
ncbi:MAG: hypothetical protein K8Q97_02795 [Candidatus Andersenbacteria bacterium]|nr:hypothetical protein [Candidatus Andersenbacteria bacterium]